MIEAVKLKADENGIDFFVSLYLMGLSTFHVCETGFAHIFSLIDDWKRDLYQVYVPMKEGVPMGICHGKKVSSYEFYGHVYFLEGFRGGDARKGFVDAMKLCIQDTGVDELVSMIPKSNKKALMFVLGCGFEYDCELESVHTDSEGNTEDVIKVIYDGTRK